jgi:hypothetical protein
MNFCLVSVLLTVFVSQSSLMELFLAIFVVEKVAL